MANNRQQTAGKPSLLAGGYFLVRQFNFIWKIMSEEWKNPQIGEVNQILQFRDFH
ncbi:hypothetical protein [Cytobacillus firmus]|uniref:hypothetical protein n=1 Tax=Cytobacillus firmus TaxID=1399 RepID=UPI0018CF6503|nr:hypothetical protein [Cytobacillus firmus]